MLLLGNDIVNLKQAGIRNKSRHTRFVNRVFTPSEQTIINHSHNPDITLWTMWAAKEAAFKVVSKIQTVPVFSHKDFEILKLETDYQGTTAVTVNFFEMSYHGFAEIGADHVHVFLGTMDFSQKDVLSSTHLIQEKEKQFWQKKENWPDFFSQEELDSIRHYESACIRHLSKKRLSKLINCDVSRLQIIRPTLDGKSQPPFLLIDNQSCKIDISLSHHENWLAWVIAVSPDFQLLS